MYIICFEAALKQMKIELTQKIADIWSVRQITYFSDRDLKILC